MVLGGARKCFLATVKPGERVPDRPLPPGHEEDLISGWGPVPAVALGRRLLDAVQLDGQSLAELRPRHYGAHLGHSQHGVRCSVPRPHVPRVGHWYLTDRSNVRHSFPGQDGQTVGLWTHISAPDTGRPQCRRRRKDQVDFFFFLNMKHFLYIF